MIAVRLCRALKITPDVVKNSILAHDAIKCGLPNIQRCNYRNKYQKMKSILKPRVPTFDHSGDKTLEQPVSLEDGETIFSYIGIDSKEIAEAHRPLYRIQNASSRDQKALLVQKVKDKFGKDELDSDSLEVQIAVLTVQIRNKIASQIRLPKDFKNKSRVNRAIDERRDLLKQLKENNMASFKWVTEELQITYIPEITDYYQLQPVGIADRLKAEAVKEMTEMKDSKMDALKQSLAKESEEYYAKKAEVMSAIKKEEANLLKEKDELFNTRIQTGYEGENGAIVYELAHIKPINKIKLWRGHPEVMKLHGGKLPKHMPRIRRAYREAAQHKYYWDKDRNFAAYPGL